MRLIHAAALTLAAMLLASIASAQGLGGAAAREREKRKTEPAKPAKVYGDSDLGNSTAVPGTSSSAETPTEGGAKPAGEGGAAADPAKQEKDEAEQAAKAREAWQKQLDQARQEEQAYRDAIDKIQVDLNDPATGFYGAGRARQIAFLDETKQKLAQAQQRIATLEEEGRRNRYR